MLSPLIPEESRPEIISSATLLTYRKVLSTQKEMKGNRHGAPETDLPRQTLQVEQTEGCCSLPPAEGAGAWVRDRGEYWLWKEQ